MNTMINPEAQPTREELLTKIELLEAEVNGLKRTLAYADESLQTYKHELKRLETLVHEHIDSQGTMFFDAVVEAFDIELTKYVTVEFTVSVQVQAQVPIEIDEDEVAQELANATLDYSFNGNGDIEIEDFSFGDLEVN